MDLNRLVCNNCFKIGHFYKDCDKPLMSYGLCCYKKVEDEYYFLMVLRRNTFTYIEFLRGLYDILDYDYLKNLFNKMSNEEKEKIKTENYKNLWNDIWMIEDNTRIKNKTEFYKGIIKFNILKNGFYHDDKKYSLDNFINDSNNKYDNAEWYFPKGKKNKGETDKETSLREFIEETNISKEKIRISDKNFNEIHLGSNGKEYKTIFYLAEYINDDYKKITEDFYNGVKNEYQRLEIGNMKWISLTELKNYFRKYEETKKELINQLLVYFNLA